MELPNKKYKVILADPPCSYNASSSKGTSEGVAERHYSLMSLEEIKVLPIQHITNNDGCVLFLWITMPHLHELKEILDAWGFEFKTTAFTWIKMANGKPLGNLGYWTRANAELCILATKGKNYPRRISTDVNQVILSKLREHSRKPDEVYTRIERLLGDLPRIELFARHKREGWDVWGNEAPTDTQKILKNHQGPIINKNKGRDTKEMERGNKD